MVADPKPQLSVGPFDRKGAIVERYSNRPDFVSLAFSYFFELQGRMVWVLPEQRELFVGTIPDFLRKGKIFLPEIGRGKVLHLAGATEAVGSFRHPKHEK